jgi:HK97 family phage prohead protease
MIDISRYANDLLTAPPAGLDVEASPEGLIESYASTFGGPPDVQGDVVRPGAFAASLAAHRRAGTLPAMLWCHRLEQPVGHWSAMEEDATGLRVRGRLNMRAGAGREAFAHVAAGDALGLSIGFLTPEGGRRYAGAGVFEITEAQLYEVSITPVPANARARIASAKSLRTKTEAVELLRAAGLSRKAAARFAAGGWPALAGDDHHERARALVSRIDAAIDKMRTA